MMLHEVFFSYKYRTMSFLYSPEKLIDVIITTKKKHDTVFLIGGGPSVKTILPDPSVLYNYDVICTNNAYKLYPNSILAHFADKTWFDWNGKHFLDTYRGFITTRTIAHRGFFAQFKNRITIFNGEAGSGCEASRRFGLNENKATINGSNAGHHAINIAAHLGYEQIVLIGYDLDVDAKDTHWHNEHHRPSNRENFKNMLDGFESITDKVQAKFNTTIYNLNWKSHIRNFQFANLEDFI